MLFLALFLACLATIAVAEPIDNHQFGFIKPGMSRGEVLRRLGIPDSEENLAVVATTERFSSGRRETTLRPKFRWCWHGNSQVPTKCVVIEGEEVKEAR